VKKMIAFSITIILLAGIFGINSLRSQEGSDQDKMMQMMMKYGTPGELHKKLEAMVGNWNFITRWWAEAGAPPEESKGTSVNKWILGGRFVQEDITGDMMGQPFHGMGITGYDNYNQKYQYLWIDEMATCFMIADGTIDNSGKIITFEGTYDDYMTGQKDKEFKSIIKLIDNDTRIYQAYDHAPDGKEYLSFEVAYKRAK